MSEEIKVGIVGTKFMGRAHSNAYINVCQFFDLPAHPALRACCGQKVSDLEAFAERFGWQSTETSWKRLVERDDIDLVDICTPNVTHMAIAVAAAKAGKHVFCEKPMAMNAREARQMLNAAQEAGVHHMIGFNYRRLPAVGLAKQLITEGKIGRIWHFNGVYYQDWLTDPDFPFVWRHSREQAGSGVHGDLNAHTIDLARYLVGEMEAVCGIQEVFTKERPLPDGSSMREVTADDATYFMARFQNGALGAFMASRVATGRKNLLRLEIYGSEGSLIFNLERLNELEFYSRADGPDEQGFRTIMVTEPCHPYMNAWWPPGHIIGWEHTFVHEVYDLLLAIAKQKSVHPDFYDGLRCQEILDAVIESTAVGAWTEVPAPK